MSNISRKPKLTTLCIITLLQACSSAKDDSNFVGYIEADLAYVAAPEAGWIEAIAMSEGAMVNSGDVLFELDKGEQIARHAEALSRVAQNDAQLRDISTGTRPEKIAVMRAQLQEAEAKLQQAAAEKNRWTDLAERGLASSSRGEQASEEFEVTKARVTAAKRSIDAARLSGREAAIDAAIAARDAAESSATLAQWQLDRRTVATRFSGRVEEVFHTVGEFVQAGAPVAAILPTDALKVRFFVPQDELSNLKRGSQVLIKADGMNEDIESVVSFIASEAEFTPPVIYSADSRGSLVFLVEAQVSDSTNLHAGLPVDVRLP